MENVNMDTLTLPALGRPFKLGMLYDARSDKLVPGITLWDNETLENKEYTDCRRQEMANFKIVTSDSWATKASALNIKANLQASFLSGLASVGGSATYLRDRKSTKHQTRVTLKYKCTSTMKELTMKHLAENKIKHTEEIGRAHV